MTDTSVQNITPELARRPVEMIVKEWRQVAIAEGIAPTKVDQYLLTRADVPEDIKSFIHKHISAEQRDIEGTASGVRTSEAIFSAEPSPTDSELSSPTSPSSEQPKGLSGEIDMLDAHSEIQSIKREIIQPSEAGMEAEREKTQELLPVTKPEEEIPVEDDAFADSREQQYVEIGTSGRVPIGISGYAPSKDVADKAEEIAEKGPICDSKTWQAMLLQRFLEIWGSFKGIFSQ